MSTINMTELRQHLPRFIGKVQAGEEIVITLRGKAVARIVPEVAESAADLAIRRLDALRGSVIVGDVMNPFAGEEWSGDADSLSHARPAVLGRSAWPLE
jgi:prevent-host-death family protein